MKAVVWDIVPYNQITTMPTREEMIAILKAKNAERRLEYDKEIAKLNSPQQQRLLEKMGLRFRIKPFVEEVLPEE